MREVILTPAGDHGYREVLVEYRKCVWNKRTREWFEYFGDEYLGEDEEVLEVRVAD